MKRLLLFFTMMLFCIASSFAQFPVKGTGICYFDNVAAMNAFAPNTARDCEVAMVQPDKDLYCWNRNTNLWENCSGSSITQSKSITALNDTTLLFCDSLFADGIYYDLACDTIFCENTCDSYIPTGEYCYAPNPVIRNVYMDLISPPGNPAFQTIPNNRMNGGTTDGLICTSLYSDSLWNSNPNRDDGNFGQSIPPFDLLNSYWGNPRDTVSRAFVCVEGSTNIKEFVLFATDVDDDPNDAADFVEGIYAIDYEWDLIEAYDGAGSLVTPFSAAFDTVHLSNGYVHYIAKIDNAVMKFIKYDANGHCFNVGLDWALENPGGSVGFATGAIYDDRVQKYIQACDTTQYKYLYADGTEYTGAVDCTPVKSFPSTISRQRTGSDLVNDLLNDPSALQMLQNALNHMNRDQINNSGSQRVHILNGQDLIYIVEPGASFILKRPNGQIIFEGQG